MSQKTRNSNRLRKVMVSLERLNCKYRKLYDKCLLNNDRETGTIALYYCHKTKKALSMAYDNYIGALV